MNDCTAAEWDGNGHRCTAKDAPKTAVLEDTPMSYRQRLGRWGAALGEPRKRGQQPAAPPQQQLELLATARLKPSADPRNHHSKTSPRAPRSRRTTSPDAAVAAANSLLPATSVAAAAAYPKPLKSLTAAAAVTLAALLACSVTLLSAAPAAANSALDAALAAASGIQAAAVAPAAAAKASATGAAATAAASASGAARTPVVVPKPASAVTPVAKAPATVAPAAAAAPPPAAAVAARAPAAATGTALPSLPMGQRPAELNPSVMVLGEFDWVPYQEVPPYTSRCTDMVNRAKAYGGGTRINFVPTHYWKDRNDDGSVDAYCYMDSSMTCLNHDAASIASFRAGMELCFRRAVEEGLGISIVPHLDDGGRTAAWRNGLLFNPKQKYGGFSYQQVMLEPVVDALAAALAATPAWVDPPPVWMALQGEMSATVLGFPRQYMALLGEMRERLLSRMRAAGASEQQIAIHRRITQVGVSFNFNKVLQVNTGGGAGGGSAASVLSRFFGFGPFAAAVGAGAGLGGLAGFGGRGLRAVPSISGSGSTNNLISTATSSLEAEQKEAAEALVPAAMPAEGLVLSGAVGIGGSGGGGRSLLAAPNLDLGSLRELFEAIDFLGISAYAALDDPNFPMTALQNAAFTFFGEMRDEVGLDVGAIIARRGIDLHYSEFGLGGGASPLGTLAARTPEQAARMPFYGVWGAYRASTDPWAPPEMRTFLHSFFRKTLDWLAQGGGPTYPVSHCFLWGMGSWDVLGIYPESTTAEGSYRDPAVVAAVQRHNARVATARVSQMLAYGSKGGSVAGR